MTPTVSEQTKHTGFSCDEEIQIWAALICPLALVLEYATLAFNLSLLDRNEQIYGRKTWSPLDPPDSATTISCLIKSGLNDRASPGCVIFFSTLVPGSGNFQLSRLVGLGYGLGLGFWVVFTILVSLTLTLTLITTLTVILP